MRGQFDNIVRGFRSNNNWVTFSEQGDGLPPLDTRDPVIDFAFGELKRCSEIIISHLRGKGGRGENGQVVSNWPYVDHVQW